MSSAAPPSRLGNALVALLFLALALWVQRSVLSSPGVLVPMPEAMVGQRGSGVYQGDQRFVVGTIATNVQKLLRGPSELAGVGFCFPLRRSYTLGEHMFGESLLALPVYLATGDPILSYNAAVILSVWITALTMYALALYWTRSIPAAFVAGMLFSFHAAKLSNPGHPFVHGNLWTPLALLFVHQLFTRRRWRDAVALAVVICLQLLESFYQVVALALLGGTYGLCLLVRHRRALPALLPKLLLVAVVGVTATWLVLGPYLHTRALWGVLQGRAATVLLKAPDYLPGGATSAGLIGLALGLLGLADRLRGSRRRCGEDPRLVLTAAGLLVFWSTLRPFRLPYLGWLVRNPLRSIGAFVPGLDAVRVLAALRFGVYLVLSFLAAYGVLRLGERLGARTRYALAAVLSVLILLEAYEPTHTLTPRSAALAAYRIYPSRAQIQLTEDLPAGAVLDLPFSFGAAGKLIDMPHYITLAAYHQRPVAACYNSFPTPLQSDVMGLTDRLPDPAAADALYAIGFRTVLIHGQRMNRERWRALAPLLDDATRLERIGESDQLVRYDLKSPLPVVATLAALAQTGQAATLPPIDVGAPEARVEFLFANLGEATFRHPSFEPLALTARWHGASGAVVASSQARGMLPLALAPGDQATRALMLAVPPDVTRGDYRVDLSPADQPALVLARREVRVR